MIIAFTVFYSLSCLALFAVARKASHLNELSSDSYREKGFLDGEENSDSCYLGSLFNATIGLSILNLSDLDLSSKTFYAEGMTWLKYSELPDWLDHWDHEVIQSPVKALRFVNNVDRHDLRLELEPSSPVQDDDGQLIQWLKFSGRFVANDLDLRQFPIETIGLPIEIELEDMYASETNLHYESSGELLATGGNISGYRRRDSTIKQWIHTYRTNWGWKLAIPCNGGDNLAEFDNIRAVIRYTRSKRSSFLGVFLPLLIIMSVVSLVPLLDIRQHENRVVIPASVLLVLVFLQDGYKKILPPGLGYPTLADLIYSACYVSTIGIFCWGLFSANRFLLNQSEPGNMVAFLNERSKEFFELNIAYLLIVVSILFCIVVSRKRLTPL